MSSNNSAKDTDLGVIMRHSPLQSSDLPNNPRFGNNEPERPKLKAFIESALLESHAFINDMHGLNYPLAKTIKSPPSIAEVSILKKTVTTNDLQNKVRWASGIIPSRKTSPVTKRELWIARRSVHASESKPRTASWQEFCSYIRSNHSKYEAEYTPDIYERRVLMSWAPEISQLSFENLTDVEMELVEMNHKVPAPLNPRTFCTLVVAGNINSDCFVVAQIPVDGSRLPDPSPSGSGKKTVKGTYVCIERCERQSGNDVIWTMASSSAAGGNLPKFAQTMGIPGLIAKDVGYFLKWIDENRGSVSESAP